MIKLKDLIPEELQNSQGEQTDFKKGDLVKDINTDCPHHGSEGEVTKVGKGTITFDVTNNGTNYQQGDELEKTVDQMVKLKESVNESRYNVKKAIKIAKKMGGDLWLAQSEVGKGSTFTFSIPTAQSKIALKIKKRLEQELLEKPN